MGSLVTADEESSEINYRYNENNGTNDEAWLCEMNKKGDAITRVGGIDVDTLF